LIAVYAVVLSVGILALIAWIFARSAAVPAGRPSLDPEARWGVTGRRVVAALVGFGMAGMSAEYSPRGIPWPLALVLALAGAAAAAWYAGRVGLESDDGEG
jgi:hypothetical protein